MIDKEKRNNALTTLASWQNLCELWLDKAYEEAESEKDNRADYVDRRNERRELVRAEFSCYFVCFELGRRCRSATLNLISCCGESIW